MRIAWLVLVAACSKSAPPADEDTPAQREAIVKLEGFADKICACTTKACAQQLSDEVTTYTRDLDKSLGSGEAKRATAKTQAHLNDVMNRFSQCLAKGLRLP